MSRPTNSPRAVPWALLPILFLVSLSGGCAWFGWPTERELVVEGVPYEDLWNRFAEVSASSGHPVDEARSDRGLREFVSKWRERPMAFGLAKRTRVHGRFEEDDGRWTIHYYVERQDVPKKSRALEPTEDDWRRDGQESIVEETMGAQLRLVYGQELRLRPTGGDPYDAGRR
jgi:hypothetical protein